MAIDKLKMHSPDLTQDNIARIRELFPSCVTESANEDGNIRLAVDFDQLRQELSDSLVEGPQERYHLDWPGKRQALLTANAPIAKTLRPYPEESLHFDTTQNLFIEGDNLDALKLLQETYLGKVKMIYIDPPYNTGSDLIYRDKLITNTSVFLLECQQIDSTGNRLVSNIDSSGRFHSDWLSMIFPRLKLARNLLCEDGFMFVSIDDGEVQNLRKICDEIFGETNFVADILWQKKTSPDARMNISPAHDHVLLYAKSADLAVLSFLPLDEERLKHFSNPDNDLRGTWASVDLTGQTGRAPKSQFYKIKTPSGIEMSPPDGRCWALAQSTFEDLVRDNRVWFGADGSNRPRLKKFLSESKGTRPWTWWENKAVGHNQEASQELKSLFDDRVIFDNPKPVRLIQRMIQLATEKTGSEIILDFFAGSASTAHAMFAQNALDSGDRKFIMIQIPQEIAVGSNDYKAESTASKLGFKSISEIGKERIRRAGKKILEGTCHENWNKDVGFRVLKVDTSNMEDVYYTPDAVGQDLLSQMTNNIKPDRSPEDLLFQVLLDWGVELSLPVRKQTIEGKTVFFVDENALVACFDKGINEGLVKKLAEFQPLRVVFTDGGFVSDAVKINVEQIFRQLSPGTEVKTI